MQPLRLRQWKLFLSRKPMCRSSTNGLARWTASLMPPSGPRLRDYFIDCQDYREGGVVKKGDTLFQIDPRPFQALLDQANGQLAQAQARFGKTELDVNRYAPLVKVAAISKEEYDDAVQADLEAKAAVLSAKAQVEQAQLSLGFTKITSPVDGITSIAKGQIGDLVGPATWVSWATWQVHD